MTTAGRTFDPSLHRRYGRPTLDPDELVKYSPKWQHSRLRYFPWPGCGLRPRMGSIVVSIDGGSEGNHIRDNPDSRAAFGVYFGPNCPRNSYGLLAAHLPQTSNRAELEALRQALKSLKQLYWESQENGSDDRSRDVIIMLDSEYVKKCMDDWILRWIKRDGYKSDGQPVQHWELIEELHGEICVFETDYNMRIRFWRVDREWNSEADALVRRALNAP